MEHGQSSLGLGWSEVSRETRRYVQFEKASRDSRDARRESTDRTSIERSTGRFHVARARSTGSG